MPKIESYRKQAKQLMRWHAEQNYSVGGKVRALPRFAHLTDAEVLAMSLPLALAQEVIAVEAGFAGWAALKQAMDNTATPAVSGPETPSIGGATPILFTRDVTAAARFYRDLLGFQIDFLHGQPPFYGSVSRGEACLHLRFVHEPNFVELARSEDSLILATIAVAGVKTLFAEYETRGVDFAQRLTRQAWGGLDFHVRDPDGNVISFVEYRAG